MKNSTAFTENRLLGQKEAAQYLSTTPPTLRNKVRKGEWAIPEVVISGRIKYDIRDLDSFIESSKRVVVS